MAPAPATLLSMLGSRVQPLDDGVQGGQFTQPLVDPNVVVGQFVSGVLAVLFAAQLDQRGGAGALIEQLV